MRLHQNLQRRLTDVRAEVTRQREALRILDEQIAYQADIAADAETRALVAGTHLADRERRATAEDLRRTQRQRDEIAARVAELLAEQDELLERLLRRA